MGNYLAKVEPYDDKTIVDEDSKKCKLSDRTDENLKKIPTLEESLQNTKDSLESTKATNSDLKRT